MKLETAKEIINAKRRITIKNFKLRESKPKLDLQDLHLKPRGLIIVRNS